jgi:CheY-like chemotaxis protein
MKKIPDPPKNVYFLYADDDPDDQDFFRSMVADIDPTLEVVLVNNGLELLQFLNNIDHSERLPCCIVLDINMPIWDGIRTLKALKVEDNLRNLPVIMFTTSRSLRDNELCLKLGAQAFITKPVNHSEFEHLFHRFTDVCRKNLPEETGHTRDRANLQEKGTSSSIE